MKTLAAAVTLFTRLPVWKIGNIPSGAYSSAVVYWPLTGWLTGGLMGLLIYWGSQIIPQNLAVIIAIIGRLLLTGALHEDGLADFCDGFGGGRDKESTLRIMKDSSIGAYGVIGLVCYFLTLWNLLLSLPPLISAFAILASDPFAKCCASQLTNILNYARAEGAKNKVAYSGMTKPQLIVNVLSGVLPFVPLILTDYFTVLSAVLPLVGLVFLMNLMKRRLGGYTGDCCGATFLICEMSMLAGIVIIFYV